MYLVNPLSKNEYNIVFLFMNEATTFSGNNLDDAVVFSTYFLISHIFSHFLIAFPQFAWFM